VDLAARVSTWIAAAVAATGAYAPLLLFGASFVEYVFPPFPGDLMVVFGAWYAVQGALSWPVTFLAVTAGAMAGAFVDHRVGVALGRGLTRGWAARLGLDPERLARFEASYRRWGVLLLLVNRFLPGVRGFLFVAAGASGIPVGTVLLYGGLSAALWNAGLLAAGALLANNVEELVSLLERYTQVAWLALVAAALLGALRWLWRRRGRRS
jgi:membrane protein DedA with SNARE-associated domain